MFRALRLVTFAAVIVIAVPSVALAADRSGSENFGLHVAVSLLGLVVALIDVSGASIGAGAVIIACAFLTSVIVRGGTYPVQGGIVGTCRQLLAQAPILVASRDDPPLVIGEEADKADVPAPADPRRSIQRRTQSTSLQSLSASQRGRHSQYPSGWQKAFFLQ